jgi:hypothetical protein
MKYYTIKPEVAGEFGPGTVEDRSVWPPDISNLHYKMKGWLGDEILEFMNVFIVTESLAASLQKSGLTGFRFEECLVTYPKNIIPKFLRLVVTGEPFRDDFGMVNRMDFVVSAQALKILKTHTFEYCDIVETEPPKR